MSSEGCRSGATCGDEELWSVLAWALSLVGAVLALLLGPNTRRVRYWAFLSIAFTIVYIIAGFIAVVFSLIPIVGGILSTAIWITVLIIWIIGIIKAINREEWRPPIIYELAVRLGGPETST